MKVNYGMVVDKKKIDGMDNWKKAPAHVEWEKDFGFFGTNEKDYSWVESCPACHEYLQAVIRDKEGKIHCYFCGQPLLPPEQHWVANHEIVGYELKGDKYYCTTCGEEVTGKIQDMHIDGAEFYSFEGSLVPCGHPYGVNIMRYKGKWKDVDQENFEWEEFTNVEEEECEV